MTTVSLRVVTEDNLKDVLGLSVSESQKDFVAPNVESLAEAAVVPEAWFRAIYADESPVGFLMLSDDRAQQRYYLWRMMIDQDHQRKGYGMASLSLLADHVSTLPGARNLYVSWMPDSGGPALFYKEFGFVETGQVEGREVEGVYKL